MKKIEPELKQAMDASAVKRGQRLDALKSQTVWQDIVYIFEQEYSAALSELIKKESAEARLKLQVITNILKKLDNQIDLGEQIKRKYEKNKFKG